MDGWKSAYIYDYSQVTPDILKELAKQSGVCLVTEKQLPVYAKDDMIAIHTAEEQEVELTVNAKYTCAKELFSGKVYPIKNGKFIYPFSSPDTALFLLSCED